MYQARHHAQAALPDVLPVFLPRLQVCVSALCCATKHLYKS